MKGFFNIKIDFDSGEASVSKNNEWDHYSPLLKLDILSDLASGLEILRQKAHEEFKEEISHAR